MPALRELHRHLGDAQVVAREDLEEDLEALRLERREVELTPVDQKKPVIGSVLRARRIGNIALVSQVARA